MSITGNVQKQDRTSGLAYVVLLSCVAALGGLLFGYDTAVIAGAIGFLESHFELTAAMKGWAASCALVGCIFGASLAGAASDTFGRKKALLLCAILFAVSAVASAVPRSLGEFALARIVGGLGVGAASILSPLYIAELAPAKHRGRLVSLNQLAIVTGILVVYFVNLLIQRAGDSQWNTTLGWRWMFGSETLPAVLFFLLLLIVPESPRWLVKQGQTQKALEILRRISGPHHAEEEINAIHKAISLESGSLRQLIEPGFRTALLIGVALAVFQQITGINAIMYYAPEIFKASGASTDTAFLQTVIVGAVNLTFTFVAIWLIDKVGRKTLLLFGSATQVVCLSVVGGFFFASSQSVGVLVFVLAYVAAFAVSLGPVVWVVVSEIFPTRIRGRAMSVAVVPLWAACFLVSQTFPMLVEACGSAGTFWLYGLASLACFLFVLFFVPETKGRTLEEIESSWRRSAVVQQTIEKH